MPCLFVGHCSYCSGRLSEQILLLVLFPCMKNSRRYIHCNCNNLVIQWLSTTLHKMKCSIDSDPSTHPPKCCSPEQLIVWNQRFISVMSNRLQILYTLIAWCLVSCCLSSVTYIYTCTSTLTLDLHLLCSPPRVGCHSKDCEPNPGQGKPWEYRDQTGRWGHEKTQGRG